MTRQSDVTIGLRNSIFLRKRVFSRCSPGVAAKLMVAFCLLGLSSASAAVITFNVVGGTLLGFFGAATFGGTITIDNSVGTVAAANITITSPYADTCTAPPVAFQHTDGPPGYFLVLFCTGVGPLTLHLSSDPTSDLIGYNGGIITPGIGISFLDLTAFVTGGSLTPISDSGFQERYSANLSIGESYINITNDGANGAALLGPGFGTATGSICVNVYALDPNEELVACCSCIVTPDATVNLGVVADLTINTETGPLPTSVTVALVATAPGANGTSATCAQSAANTAAVPLASGMLAFGTTLHSGYPAGSYATTETPFLNVTPAANGVTATNLASLQGRCAGIIGNASGFGICTSCRSGALGGQKI